MGNCGQKLLASGVHTQITFIGWTALFGGPFPAKIRYFALKPWRLSRSLFLPAFSNGWKVGPIFRTYKIVTQLDEKIV